MFPNKEAVERVRRQYPKGTRVELVSMSDPYTALKPGDKGTVDFVDDTATIFVRWDNGSGLGVVYGEDSVKHIPLVSGKVKEQILVIRKTGQTNMFDVNMVQRLALEASFHDLVDFLESDRKAYSIFILTGDEG